MLLVRESEKSILVVEEKDTGDRFTWVPKSQCLVVDDKPLPLLVVSSWMSRRLKWTPQPTKVKGIDVAIQISMDIRGMRGKPWADVFSIKQSETKPQHKSVIGSVRDVEAMCAWWEESLQHMLAKGAQGAT